MPYRDAESTNSSWEMEWQQLSHRFKESSARKKTMLSELCQQVFDARMDVELLN
jgi:hypothetical protein